MLERVFSLDKGSGFSLMKTTMAANDFMSAGPWYTYDETAGDTQLINFTISRDLRVNGSLTFIKRAKNYGEFHLQSYLDFPPTWMMNGTDLNREYYPSMADYYLRYIQEYKANNITIDYLSLFNEPEDSYIQVTLEENLDLLVNHVGPLFRHNNITTLLSFASHCARNISKDYIFRAMENKHA